VVMSGLGESIGAIPDLVASLMMTGCFGTVIGFAQWAILRRHVLRSGVWIGFTFLGSW
jgi:putative effector of murein hydrolase